MNVKILIRTSDDGDIDEPEEIRVELFSQNDYFFLYSHTADVFTFQEMKRA